MFLNYLKIALRNVHKHKGYKSINILELTSHVIEQRTKMLPTALLSSGVQFFKAAVTNLIECLRYE